MFLMMALFNVFHPSNIISKKSMNTSWNESEAGGSYGYGDGVGKLQDLSLSNGFQRKRCGINTVAEHHVFMGQSRPTHQG